MNIEFEKANESHKTIVMNWLNEPHVMEFWDNSQGHKDDIVKFIEGRIEPSKYANGLYTYWIGSMDGIPYCMIMTIKEEPGVERASIKDSYLSKTGTTYSIDYMIGNTDFIGRGLGSKTLDVFTTFFQKSIEPNADTFFIDPDLTNPRAKRVYKKAGFKFIDNFIMDGGGVFAGKVSSFMVKKRINNIILPDHS